MNMVLHETTPTRQHRPILSTPNAISVDEETLSKLMPIRHLLRDCRSARRIDGRKVCAAVACGVAQRQDTLSISLMQILRDEWGQAPVIFQPSARSASFDEVWLLSLAKAKAKGDVQSVAFLLSSRLPRHAHREVLSLVADLLVLE